MGEIISELARKALIAPAGSGFAESQAEFMTQDWPTLPARGGPPVTLEMIERIQDEFDQEDMVPWDHERDAPRIFDDEPVSRVAGATKPAKKKPRIT